MSIFKKKRIKQEIPTKLKKELKELQDRLEKEGPPVRYSISLSESTLDRAKKEIKETELEPTFKDLLFEFIDKKGLTDPEIYKKAKVNKRTFSKIRTEEEKHVSKNTAICLGLALELDQKDFEKLLNANSNYLSDNDYFGIAIKWCIKNKIYDIEQVNDILYACDLPLLTR